MDPVWCILKVFSFSDSGFSFRIEHMALAKVISIIVSILIFNKYYFTDFSSPVIYINVWGILLRYPGHSFSSKAIIGLAVLLTSCFHFSDEKLKQKFFVINFKLVYVYCICRCTDTTFYLLFYRTWLLGHSVPCCWSCFPGWDWSRWPGARRTMPAARTKEASLFLL